MALSEKAKKRFIVAMARRVEAQEIIDAIESGSNAQAAEVNYTSGTNLVGVDGAGSNAAPLAGTETRLDAIDTAIQAILTSLKNAGIMEDA